MPGAAEEGWFAEQGMLVAALQPPLSCAVTVLRCICGTWYMNQGLGTASKGFNSNTPSLLNMEINGAKEGLKDRLPRYTCSYRAT